MKRLLAATVALALSIGLAFGQVTTNSGVSGVVNLASPGPIGATTPATGSFTTLTLGSSAISDYWIQRVTTQSGAVASGTTVIPIDDTIPQNTEGVAWTALDTTITPTSATSKLEIVLTIAVISNTIVNTDSGVALFQDSTVGALAATVVRSATVNAGQNLTLRYVMTSGTTSATTFKIRFGPDSGGGTTTVNGVNTARLFGGVAISTLTVTEYK